MSSLDDLESPWGQLVNLDTSGDEDAEIIPIVGDEFTIGRGKGERILLYAKIISEILRDSFVIQAASIEVLTSYFSQPRI